MQKTISSYFLIKMIAFVLISMMSSFTFAGTVLNFESIADDNERIAVYRATANMFHMPDLAADDLLADFATLPEYGWQGQWLTQLKALDLAAYIVEIETAQYYASAGKWRPPEHKYQIEHIEFYRTIINRGAALYSHGISHETIYKFAEKFVATLFVRTGPKKLNLLKTLLQTNRELWFNAIIWYGFKKPAVKFSVLQELIEAMPVFNDIAGDRLSYLIEAISNRPSETERSLLIRSVYAQMLIKNDPAKIYYNERGCDIVLSIDAEFSKLPGQQSRIVK